MDELSMYEQSFSVKHRWQGTVFPTQLKGAQVWDFDVLDFNDFFIMKSL
jgi:hypothetical protein